MCKLLFGKSQHTMPQNWIAALADKWHEIPLTATERGSSIDQLKLSDDELIRWWDDVARQKREQDFIAWMIEVYRDFIRGKKLIEVGPGMGWFGVECLKFGATVTFIDVANSNLRLIERVCRIKELRGDAYLPLCEFSDPLKLSDDYDAVFAIGSLHHTPSEIAKPEFEALASRLKIGGRFIALTYPKERWEHEGRKPFSEFGKGTDGPRTPWAEWYDVEKFMAQLAPNKFRVLLDFNFGPSRKDDFNWFDLQRTA
jgi:hypothetical protein